MEQMNNFEVVGNAETVKVYKLSKLKPDNIFTCVTILSKIGITEIKTMLSPENLKELLKSAKDGEESTGVDVEKIGFDLTMDIAGVILANLESCKSNVYQLLSDLSGMSVEQIKNLDAAVFLEMIIDVFKQDGFKDFFKVVLKFLK